MGARVSETQLISSRKRMPSLRPVFAHGVGGDGELLSAVGPRFDEGQAHGALAGVVGDGVGHQAHAGLGGHLLHDLGFAHARGAHQQDGPLADRGD